MTRDEDNRGTHTKYGSGGLFRQPAKKKQRRRIMGAREYLFTSESVTEGHPDKVADQISDAILDAHLSGDPKSRVACETLVTTGLVVIAGEITSKTTVHYQEVARRTIKEIGYEGGGMGFDWEGCAVVVTIDRQSPDIAMGVNEGAGKEQGAGDQGLMFGYACNHTSELMPMPLVYSHKLTKRLADVRKNNTLTFLRPDGKSQVTVRYRDKRPVAVEAGVISTQHTPEVTQAREKAPCEKIEAAIRKVFPLKPADLIKELNLLRPIYRKTAAYGHFGRNEPDFTWERTDKTELLKKELGR